MHRRPGQEFQRPFPRDCHDGKQQIYDLENGNWLDCSVQGFGEEIPKYLGPEKAFESCGYLICFDGVSISLFLICYPLEGGRTCGSCQDDQAGPVVFDELSHVEDEENCRERSELRTVMAAPVEEGGRKEGNLRPAGKRMEAVLVVLGRRGGGEALAQRRWTCVLPAGHRDEYMKASGIRLRADIQAVGVADFETMDNFEARRKLG